MPSAFTHGLLPAACALSTARNLFSLDRKQWKKFLFVCFVLGNSPDLDLIPAIVFPSHFHDVHRELGHNVFALTLWIWLGVKTFRSWVSPAFAGKRAWIFSAALVLSHVLLDSCADAAPGTHAHPGVPLLWPLSNWELVTPLPLFGGYNLVPASHPILAHLITPGFWWTFLTREVAITLAVSAGWYLATKSVQRLVPAPALLRKEAETRRE